MHQNVPNCILNFEIFSGIKIAPKPNNHAGALNYDPRKGAGQKGWVKGRKGADGADPTDEILETPWCRSQIVTVYQIQRHVTAGRPRGQTLLAVVGVQRFSGYKYKMCARNIACVDDATRRPESRRRDVYGDRKNARGSPGTGRIDGVHGHWAVRSINQSINQSMSGDS